MKRLLLLSILLVPASSVAGPPAPEPAAPAPAAGTTSAAEQTVQRVLITPLAAKEKSRSRFSRAAPPPTARRVLLLDTVAHKDAQGGEYLTFALEARHGLELDDESGERRKWSTEITGCVYPATNVVFLRHGTGYRSSDYLLGKRVPQAPAHTCEPASPQS